MYNPNKPFSKIKQNEYHRQSVIYIDIFYPTATTEFLLDSKLIYYQTLLLLIPLD